MSVALESTRAERGEPLPHFTAAQRMLAQHVVDITALLVHEIASQAWDRVPASLAARTELLRQLRAQASATQQHACLAALFAAMDESEQTLRIVAVRPR